MKTEQMKCTAAAKCGGCCYMNLSLVEQSKKKQEIAEKYLRSFGRIQPCITMEDPFYYRNKVHRVIDRDKKGNIIAGIYEENSHRTVNVRECLIEDRKSQEIILTICRMLKSFKIRTYDEDTGYGLLRHVLVRRGFSTGEILVVLVTASPVFPSRNNFVKALREQHPEITTIVQNINDRQTSMVLGSRNVVLYGKGYILDMLCGCAFRLSPSSFYQVNPAQTERLYGEAIRLADLRGKETVLDAYCGIGTIGLIASKKAGRVLGVELNGEAVKDAVLNARQNKAENIHFVKADASDFMEEIAREKEKIDLVFMDPPRAGSDRRFLTALTTLSPEKIVYISCNPETLARDLSFLVKKKYKVNTIQPVDMFPFTRHVETVVLMTRNT